MCAFEKYSVEVLKKAESRKEVKNIKWRRFGGKNFFEDTKEKSWTCLDESDGANLTPWCGLSYTGML